VTDDPTGPVFTPAVYYRDPKSAVAWLERAFGFETTVALEGPGGDPTMSHYELALNGSGRLVLGGEWTESARSPASVGRVNTADVVVLLPAGLDAHCERARAAGAVIAAEPADEPYGDRIYRAVDPEGHRWTFAVHVESG
jgi:uncharacterized glyoxalase superfamily protein PhnB